MSELRRVELDIDLITMEQTAKSLGLRTERNTIFSYYGSRTAHAELVVHLDGYSVGFSEKQMVIDSMNEVRVLKDLIAPYKQRVIERRLAQGKWKIYGKTKVGKELIIEVG